MNEPHIFTFEKDIENEIRTKSASLSDIAASSGIVENKPEKAASYLVLIIVACFFLLLAAIGAFYYYVTPKNEIQAPKEKIVPKVSTNIFENKERQEKDTVKKETSLSSSTDTLLIGKKIITTPFATLMPNIAPFLDKNIVRVESYNDGYLLTFTGYTTVYKTILDNESLFQKDITLIYKEETSGTSTPFKDIRIGTVDARVSTVGEKSFYYLFSKPSFIIIANNQDTLKNISDAILK